jgi:hypothetical protein
VARHAPFPARTSSGHRNQRSQLTHSTHRPLPAEWQVRLFRQVRHNRNHKQQEKTKNATCGPRQGHWQQMNRKRDANLTACDKGDTGSSRASGQNVPGVYFALPNRASCACEYTKGLGVYARNFTNRVSGQTTIEITKVSPTRIEGRAMVRPAGTKFDCKNGTYTKPPSEWQTFSWIPE